MASNLLSQFGKGKVAEELFIWSVLAEAVRALGSPLFEELRQLVNTIDPIQALAVADAVDAVIKGHLTRDQGAFEAAKSGLDGEHFDVLVAGAGEPPALEFLLEAWRRGFIERAGEGAGSTSLEQGIRESRLKDKWITVVESMGLRPIAVADAIDAWVEGQIDEGTAKAICYQNGVSAEDATILFHTRGRPPSPTELLELHKRGLIPLEGTGPDETTVQQGIFEGATKDKWWRLLAALGEYLPPPRTVTAMVREGALSDQQALDLFRKAGLSDELAGAYLAAAHHQKTQAERELTKSDILDLYQARIITPEQTTTMLGRMHYNAQDAAFLMAYRDFQVNKSVITKVIGRIQTLYLNRKLDAAQASNALDQLKMPAAQRDQLLKDWNLERALQVQRLTAAEIVDAAFYKIISEQAALDELMAMGWAPYDAWVRLGVRLHRKPELPVPTQTLPGP